MLGGGGGGSGNSWARFAIIVTESASRDPPHFSLWVC